MATVAIDVPKPLSPIWRNFKEALRRHPTAIIGGVVLLAMIVVAILAPWLGTVDPQAVAPVKRLKQPRPPSGSAPT
jgi:peptide/nickel transport system permease protein